MTAHTPPSPTTSPATAFHTELSINSRPSVGLGFGGLLRSEAVKLRSLRSSWWLAVMTVLISAGGGWLQALTFGWAESPTELGLTPIEATRAVLDTATQCGQLLVVILAVLTITAEYASGTIQPTMTTVPRRLPVLAAKIFVVASAAAVLGSVSSITAYLLSWPVLDRIELGVAPGVVLTTAVGGVVYLVVMAVFALLVGTIVRTTAVGVVAVLTVILVLPVALAFAPGDVDLNQYTLPSGAQVMAALIADPGSATGVGVAVAVTVGWLAVAAGGAVAVLSRRDV